MSWTLLTNDDGVDSPALVPFAKALADLSDVRTVVPDRERSWVGKAITRFDGVSVDQQERGGIRIHTCSGYPADAAQLGMHVLFDSPPDLVVSGINVGRNHGAGFVASSGTVGAAVEAWTSGIRSIAFSTGGPHDMDYDEWKRWVLSPDGAATWATLASVCAGLIEPITASGIFEIADVVNVNLASDATVDTPVRVTSVARVGYTPLHASVVDGVVDFGFNGELHVFGDLAGTDVQAARDGVVSVTPLLMPLAADVPPVVRSALEGRT